MLALSRFLFALVAPRLVIVSLEPSKECLGGFGRKELTAIDGLEGLVHLDLLVLGHLHGSRRGVSARKRTPVSRDKHKRVAARSRRAWRFRISR